VGLDSVVLVLDVEEHFGISIGDEEVADVHTVGDLATVVAGKLGPAHNAETVFRELAEVIAESSGVALAKIAPTARIVRDLGIN
jgi:succinyl-CoA synthetase alpha subunit